MGVRGLQTYIENYCQGACPEVHIPELVTNYKYETGNQNPIIVVDGSSCLRPLYGDLEFISGGQMKQYAEKLIFFVTQFRQLGVKLVFFFDGPTANRKRATWVQRRMNTMHNVYKILDLLANDYKTTDIDKKIMTLLPSGISFVTQQILQDECGCEIYTSIVECDEEIADYARKNNCFAILGQDSDYVIYDSNHYYLSIIHLDIKTMKTLYYNRWELAKTLRIHPKELPLLATLIGNDVIPAEDLKPFHREVIRRLRGPYAKTHYQILFPCIGQYIQRLPKGDALLRSLPDIAHAMFGDRSKANLISTSLQSYYSSAFQGPVRQTQRLLGWEGILEESKYRHMTNYFPSMVYSVLNGLPFESSTQIEDFRCTDLKSSVSVVRPLRQRVYGILLHEKPPGSGPCVVRELCMEGPGSLDEEKIVYPFPPRAHHPGLLTLWTDTTEQVIDMKWKLFVTSVSTKLQVEKIKCLPMHLILPSLILCYITEEKVFNDWEVDAMLATAVVLEQYTTKHLSELPADPVSIRAVRAVPLYLRVANGMNLLSASCGYPLNQKYANPCKYFDGKLFQIKYQAAEKCTSLLELCDNQVTFMEDFQKVKSVISDVK